MDAHEPFYFYTRLNQTELLGRSARNVVELLEGIKAVPDSSIYQHTHRILQQYHYMSPAPPNDFAYWITDALNEDALGETMANVDVIEFEKMGDVRDRFVAILNDFLKHKRKIGMCPASEEFHFMACKTFILPTPYVAHTVEEFRRLLEKVSVHSLYFHLFEARLRLRRIDNDFSLWFRDLGAMSLANELSRLDPYSYSLKSLRTKILTIIDKEKGTSG